MRLQWIVLSVVLGFSVGYSAPVAAKKVTRLEQIVSEQRMIAEEISIGRTGAMSPQDVAEVQKAQQEVFSIVGDKTLMNQLSPDEKLQLKNALETIKAGIAGTHRAQDQKEVCWRERTTGSRMSKTRCGTEQERMQAREDARGYLDRPHACAIGCGGD